MSVQPISKAKQVVSHPSSFQLAKKCCEDPKKIKIVALADGTLGTAKINSFWSHVCCCCYNKKKEMEKEINGTRLFERTMGNEFGHVPFILEVTYAKLTFTFDTLVTQGRPLTFYKSQKILHKANYYYSFLSTVQGKRITKGIAYYLQAIPLKNVEKQEILVNNQDIFNIPYERFKAFLEEVPVRGVALTKELVLDLARRILPRCLQKCIADVDSPKGELVVIEEFILQGFTIDLPQELTEVTFDIAYVFMAYVINDRSEHDNWGNLFSKYLTNQYGAYAANRVLFEVEICDSESNERIRAWKDLQSLSYKQALALASNAARLSAGAPSLVIYHEPSSDRKDDVIEPSTERALEASPIAQSPGPYRAPSLLPSPEALSPNPTYRHNHLADITLPNTLSDKKSPGSDPI